MKYLCIRIEEDKSAKTQEQHSGKRKATGGGGKAEQIRELPEVVDKARVDNAKVNQLKALPDMGTQVNYVAKQYMLERYPFLLGLTVPVGGHRRQDVPQCRENDV